MAKATKDLETYLKTSPIAKKAKFAEMNLNMKVRENDEVNCIYRVNDDLFVHAYNDEKGNRYYASIGPKMTPEEEKKFGQTRERMLTSAFYSVQKPMTQEEFKKEVMELLSQILSVNGEKAKGLLQGMLGPKITVSEEEKKKIIYFTFEDFLNFGKITPLLKDEFIEEISCTGTRPIWIVHKVFGAMQTNIFFDSESNLQKFIYKTTEVLDRPATETHPIVDVALPDGSRLNVLFGEDISKRGTSFTIREFTDVPVSITQLIKWNTMSAKEAAYLWMAIDSNSSVFICGETASGKTTTLKALAVFIDGRSKIFSVEDTPEIFVPHKNWQRTITLEGKVGMFKLLEISLVSRPNYVIVGEFRDQEGAIAFQGMQAGYPVMATFHAGSINSLIQRLTGDPIYIPKDFIGNLNIVIFQSLLNLDHRIVRRALAMHEIEGYSSREKSIVTRQVFEWNPKHDRQDFKGIYNSYVLEAIVAKKLKIPGKKMVYQELDKRTKFIESLVKKGTFNYYDVFREIEAYKRRSDEE